MAIKRKNKLTPAEINSLKLLRAADEALYQLWKNLPLDGSEFVASLNALQKQFIHPSIKNLTPRD